MPLPPAAPTPTLTTHTPATQGDESSSGPTPLPPGSLLPAAEIKGRHTLQDISGQCHVPLPALIAALGLPSDAAVNTPIKDLVGTGNITELQVVRDIVAALQQK